ncbi:maltose acetyltransferase domain-containing protein [Blautia ammoniilytica]|uniref:Maltose/galactoside acetyltransferase domain-containing protein n=1 Tax=Blautia ammoniilytica TaxID=2981782 RepID=A0ABT2TY23_9FIRM|nr:maltose acetyltransferase domain-containing protein [Blautia ammoniilytica]MCU6766962.1 hypothetical protein [Blautia ammoniilytica]SCI94199.1 Maltose O-acetyltransferase [uncultured Blautia sp.]
MTEREKMISGKLYNPTDKELEQLRLNARKLARKYNLTDEDQQEEQMQILRQLLPATEELPYLQAPVYFDCKLRSNGMPVPLLRNGYSIFNGTKYR